MTYKRTLAALALALLVVTAGCSSGTTDGQSETTIGEDGATTTATTSTNAATTSASADLSGMALPSGVTEAGLTNVSALVQSHNRSLDGTPYRVSLDIDGDQQSSVTVVHGPDAERLEVESANTTIRSWQRGPRTVTAQTASGETQYQYAYGNSGNTFGSTFQLYSGISTLVVTTYLHVGDYNATGVVTRDGTKLVKLTAERANYTAAEQFATDGAAGNSTIASFESTAFVDQNGVVRELDATVTETIDGETTTGTVSYSVDDLGSATVEEPDWLANVPRLDATVTDDGVVAIEHVGGATLESGVQLTMIADGTLDGATVPENVTEGETLYFYVAEDEDGRKVVRASVGEKPPADEVAVDVSTADQLMITGSFGDVSVTLSPTK